MSQSHRFLKYARVDSFGAFFNKTVGPFSPGLNVVFGRNEAGKTTFTQFVSGVLFGWEDARGGKNTYKPTNAERSGALIFADDVSRETHGELGAAFDEQNKASNNLSARPDGLDGAGASAGLYQAAAPSHEATASAAEYEVFRARNVDGLQGSADIVSDIDKETFQTMFLLTSDELRSLRNTSDVTARLLTAGSGTNSSPAQALAEINERIQSYSSRAASATESVTRLSEQIKEARVKMQRALEQTEQFKAEDREHRELTAQRKRLSGKIAELNSEIDFLVAKRAQLQKVTEQKATSKGEIAKLKEEAAQQKVAATDVAANIDEYLLALDQLQERALSDQLDEFADQQVHVARSIEIAEENQRTSQAAYDALVELASSDDRSASAHRQRALQIAMSIVLPVAFALIGILLFMRGRIVGSLSFTGLGLALVVLGAILAVGAFLLVLRPKNEGNGLDQRMQDAQWVMLQDKKKLQSVRDVQKELADEQKRWLDAHGFAKASGSIRQARSLLNEARAVRADIALDEQRAASFALRLSSAESNLAELNAQQTKLIAAIEDSNEGVALVAAHTHLDAPSADFSALDELIDKKAAQRDELVSALEHISLRYGRLEELLSQAKLMHAYDEAKQDYQQLLTRLEDSKRDLAKLLIARRLLETAIATWESRSQPEVYRRASKLLELMTGGKWVRISLTPEGKLVATDAVRNSRTPRELSLGTCQQLYLALRIALLMCADNVGSSIPIMADDILVNFDSERRAGAAQALAQLANRRQVILFTCHEEVVEAMSAADASATLVRL